MPKKADECLVKFFGVTMNRDTKKQILAVMAPYHKRGIPFRRKQIKRLIAILDDIFIHEPYLGERLQKVGKRQIIGYWQRTRYETAQVRAEKYAILKLFFETAQLTGRVPRPK
ncbi:hypothetical protein [Vibrio parahaemolyticus]|uniref:hypothetical protein n=1 Tax=Vibrio parahaemolyticus TaxID=670 RepID=UPI00236304F2|nr:hypothetical protein [Vibrio parahaemolyticus]